MSQYETDPAGIAGVKPEEVTPKIAHHTSYIPETKRVLREYVTCGSYDALRDRVIEDNIVNKDTDYYRKSVLREITRRYIPDKESFRKTPLMHLLTADIQDDVVDWCLYYEFSQDPFVRLVTEGFLFPEFERGQLAVTTEDLVEYLHILKDEYPEIESLEDHTIEAAALQYLAALKNFGLLEGRQRKEFAVTYIPDETIAYVVYRIRDKGAEGATSMIEHPDWRLLLMTKKDVQRRVGGVSPQYLTYEKRGSTERLTLDYDSTVELIDAF